jgi:hypothetical protein
MRQAKNMALAGLVMSALIVPMVQLPGCGVFQPLFEPGVTPSVEQYFEMINKMKQDAEVERSKALERCGGDPTCEKNINERFDQLQKDLDQLKLDILRESWGDAREYLKKLREKYADMTDLIKIIEKMLEKILEKKVVNVEGVAVPTDQSSGGSRSGTCWNPADDTVAMRSLQYNVALNAGTTTGSVGITGSFVASGDQGLGQGLGVGTWPISSGSFVMGSLPGLSHSMRITPDTLSNIPSQLTIRADGTGELQLVMDMNDGGRTRATQANWHLVNPLPMRFPVRVLANGTLQVTGTGSQLFKPDPWAASDYDKDGVLSFDLDFEAFLAGMEAKERLADSNFDGAFDGADVELWIKRFDEDMSR